MKEQPRIAVTYLMENTSSFSLPGTLSTITYGRKAEMAAARSPAMQTGQDF